ncbi:lactonase family protein [Rhodoferax aquaticus]|nr:lactonase family protein [Rhodoferax aquaticus]
MPNAISPTPTRPLFAYVGTYTDGGKPWRGGVGSGVHQFAVDPDTGALQRLPNAPVAALHDNSNAPAYADRNPATLARHPNTALAVLYVANEFDGLTGPNTSGSVSAYAMGPNGALQFLAEVDCGGKNPAYISVHPEGRYLFTANYVSGDVSVIALRADGHFDSHRPARVYPNALCCGATPCAPGANVVPQAALDHEGFALSDHDGPHAHMVQADPSGNFVLVTDLGLDRVIAYRFDRDTGALSAPTSACVTESSGARHFIFHANGRWLYVVNEEASTVAFFTFDPGTGQLTWVSETSTLPAGFKGTSFASNIQMLPSGSHFVVLNRLHDSIAIFELDASTGAPSCLGEEWTRGSFPRSCTLDPSGRYLYVCHNKQGDNVTVFAVDGHRLHFTGQYIAVGSASMLVFSH